MTIKNTVSEKGVLHFQAVDIFGVVIDVEKYPEFLPWCKSVKIVFKEQNKMVADTKISFSGIEASYDSIITYSAPSTISPGYVNVKSSSGVFTKLLNDWKFIPQNHNTTLVEFCIDFEFKSSLMQYLLNIMYKRAQKKVLESFYERINKICRKQHKHD